MAVKYTAQVKKQILEKFLAYIEETEHPLLCEFAYKINIPETTLQTWGLKEPEGKYKGETNISDFPRAYKKMLAKAKTFLTKNGSAKGVNPAMYIFQLKACHGLRDSEPAPAAQTNVNLNIDKILNSDADKLESGVQDMLQSVKIDNNRKRKTPKSSQN